MKSQFKVKVLIAKVFTVSKIHKLRCTIEAKPRVGSFLECWLPFFSGSEQDHVMLMTRTRVLYSMDYIKMAYLEQRDIKVFLLRSH